jgi:hypothetical protein
LLKVAPDFDPKLVPQISFEEIPRPDQLDRWHKPKTPMAKEEILSSRTCLPFTAFFDHADRRVLNRIENPFFTIPFTSYGPWRQ